MLAMLNRLIVRTSSTPWLFVTAFAVNFGTLQAMFQIARRFEAETGFQPFDLQNGLTPQQVLAQLPAYTDHARQLYFGFTALDYIFPFAGALFMSGIAAFCLRRSFPQLYAALVARNLLPLLMLASLFDWCENVAAITAILSWPDTTTAMATAIVVAKKLKLGFLYTTWSLVAVLVAATLVLAVARVLRKRTA